MPIVNFDLDKPEWVCIEEGEETWRVIVSHTNDEVMCLRFRLVLWISFSSGRVVFTWDNRKS